MASGSLEVIVAELLDNPLVLGLSCSSPDNFPCLSRGYCTCLSTAFLWTAGLDALLTEVGQPGLRKSSAKGQLFFSSPVSTRSNIPNSYIWKRQIPNLSFLINTPPISNTTVVVILNTHSSDLYHIPFINDTNITTEASFKSTYNPSSLPVAPTSLALPESLRFSSPLHDHTWSSSYLSPMLLIGILGTGNCSLS